MTKFFFTKGNTRARERTYARITLTHTLNARVHTHTDKQTRVRAHTQSNTNSSIHIHTHTYDHKTIIFNKTSKYPMQLHSFTVCLILIVCLFSGVGRGGLDYENRLQEGKCFILVLFSRLRGRQRNSNFSQLTTKSFPTHFHVVFTTTTWRNAFGYVNTTNIFKKFCSYFLPLFPPYNYCWHMPGVDDFWQAATKVGFLDFCSTCISTMLNTDRHQQFWQLRFYVKRMLNQAYSFDKTHNYSGNCY